VITKELLFERAQKETIVLEEEPTFNQPNHPLHRSDKCSYRQCCGTASREFVLRQLHIFSGYVICIGWFIGKGRIEQFTIGFEHAILNGQRELIGVRGQLQWIVRPTRILIVSNKVKPRLSSSYYVLKKKKNNTQKKVSHKGTRSPCSPTASKQATTKNAPFHSTHSSASIPWHGRDTITHWQVHCFRTRILHWSIRDR
jgi:hypothetical protein